MVMLLGLLWKVASAALAVLLLRAILIWFDGTSAGKKFTEDVLNAGSPDEKTRYYSYRFVGVCILVGFLFF